jgi:membrane dipeptidase
MSLSEKAKDLHRNTVVADLHCDTPLQIRRGYEIGERHNHYHIDIPRLKEAGVDLQVFALFVDAEIDLDKCFLEVENLYNPLISQIEKNKEQIEICKSVTEFERIKSSNKISAFLGIENGMAIENDLRKLEYYYEKGVRYMTLSHSKSHDWCSSSSDEGRNKFGLTDFGREVVTKMNELGMIVDVSHISVKAFYDVIDTSDKPIIASHSNAYAICSHDRNLNDEQLKAVAKNGGVVGINFASHFLSEQFSEELKQFFTDNPKAKDDVYRFFLDNDETVMDKEDGYFALVNKIRNQFVNVYPDLTVIADHIDYMTNLIGFDHIALGSDYDGLLNPPKGVEDCSKLPNLTAELLNRGYNHENIKKILGLNFIRVFKEICD